MPSKSLQHEQTQDRQEKQSTQDPQRDCLHLANGSHNDSELLTAADGSVDTVYFFPTLLDEARERSDNLKADMESYLGIYMNPFVQTLAYVAISGIAISGAVVAKSTAIGLPVKRPQRAPITPKYKSKPEDGIHSRKAGVIMSSKLSSEPESTVAKQQYDEEIKRHSIELGRAKEQVSTQVARIGVLEQQLLEAEELITRATEKLTSQDDELDRINKHLKKVNRKQMEEDARLKSIGDAKLVQLQNVQRDLYESSTKRKELEVLIAGLQEQIQAREGDLVSAKAKAVHLSELVKSQYGAIDSYKRKLDSSENSSRNLQADLSHLVQELNTLKTKHAQDGDDIRARFEKQIAELSLQLSNAESAKTALASQFDEFQTLSERKLLDETKSKGAAYAKLRGEMIALKKSITADMAQAETYIAELRSEHAEELGKRTTELEATGKLVSAHADTIIDLKSQYANILQERGAELENTKTLHNSEILDLEDSHAAELEYMKKAITTAQQEAKQLRADHNNILQKNQVITSESSAHSQRAETLSHEVDYLKALQKRLTLEREALEERSRCMMASNERLQSQVTETEHKFSLLAEEKSVLTGSLEILQRNYEEKQAAYTRVVEQTSETKAKLIESFAGQLRAQCATNDALRQESQAISSELSKVKDLAEASARSLSIANAKETDLTMQLKQMEDQRIANNLIAVETAKQFDAVRGEIKQHKESCMLLVKEQDSLRTQYHDQSEQLRQAIADAADGKNHTELLRTEKNNLEQKLETLQENVNQNSVLLEKSRTDLSAATKETSKLQGLYEAKSTELHVTRTNLDENSTKLDQLIAQTKEAIQLHANEIGDLREKHKQALASSENKAKDQQSVITKLLLDKTQLIVEHEKTVNLMKNEMQATKTSHEQSAVLADDRSLPAEIHHQTQEQSQVEAATPTSPLVVDRRVSISSQTSAAPQASDLDDIFSALDRTNIRAGSLLKEQRVERSSPLRARSDAFDTLMSSGEVPVSSPTPSTNEESNGVGKASNRLTGLLRRSASKQLLSRKGSAQILNTPAGP